jgi:hypothetical protein
MILPTRIVTLDNTRCSLNCQLMQYGHCCAKGQDEEKERLNRDSSVGYLRTDYCKENAVEES